MAINLYEHQKDALNHIRNGSILAGDVGSGKSITSLAYYYFIVCEGGLKFNGSGHYLKMKQPRDLYIITTAKKRDSYEWDDELINFLLMQGYNKAHGVTVTVDSWNNIKKYSNVTGAFFIFDEQRVVGRGAWVKAFLKIARRNKWILLSATPGDKWEDYIPVFIANGFYKNRSEFEREHCVYARFSKYPKLEKHINTGILCKHRRDILVKMDFKRNRKVEKHTVLCEYDKAAYKRVWKDRIDIDTGEPIFESGKLFYVLRKVVNDDDSRSRQVLDIFSNHKKLIIFYNFTYELERLRQTFMEQGIEVSEWNGHVHNEVPGTNEWVYLVQYNAGAEGWNCITTDTIVFYSQSYSYRMTKQAEGRIDRLNTPYDTLHYYYLRSNAPIDLAIRKALLNKENFNESEYLKGGKMK